MVKSAFDNEFPPFEQDQWREGLTDTTITIGASESDDIISPSIAEIISTQFWLETRSLVRLFITTCIFSPKKTVKTWWSLTAPKKDNVIRINVGSQEVLAVCLNSDELSYFIVGATTNVRNALSGDAEISVEASGYKFSDQLKIAGKDLNHLEEVLNLRAIRLAARRLSLDLMKNSRNQYPQHHCPKLLSQIV